MEMDRLELQIQAESKKANAELDKVINKLGQVSNKLESLKNVDFGSISSEAAKISEMAKNIAKFGNASTMKAMNNLPVLAKAFKEFITTISSAPNVSENIIRMTNAMANLASNGSKYSSTINGMSRASKTLARRFDSTIPSTKNLGNAFNSTKFSATSLISKITSLATAYYLLRQATGFVGDSIKSSMNFGETVNLFQVTFKKVGMDAAVDAGMSWGSEAANAYAKEFITKAQTFNDQIVDALGLDPNTMMKYQAMFASMANSIGLTSDTVVDLSNSFTMLGADMASLYNISIDDAMTKLKAGIAGETEPLRSLGVDITEATLKQVALKHGIDDTVASMTYAQKTQLRYLAIMEQTNTAWGDMAKTIQSPANQLRILSQQWENLSRTVGSVFIPIATEVLPYINGIVIALREFVGTIASAAGYDLPDWSDYTPYTDLTSGVDDYTNATDSATDSTNALKKAVMGFDELNILSANKTKSVNTSGGSGYPELDNAIGKETDSYMSKFNDQLAEMKNKSQEIADNILPKIKEFVDFFKNLSPLLEGVATSIGVLAIFSFFTNLGSKIGTIANLPGLPVALAIGGIVAIYEAVKLYNQKLIKEDLASRFGDIVLSLQEINTIANTLTTSKYTANIDVYVNEKSKLKDMEKDIQADIDTLNELNWKVSVGLKLTPEEQKTYEQTIEKFITDSEAYIVQQQYVVDLAIKAVAPDDTAFSTEMQTLVDDYFEATKGKMESLGKKLRKTMDDALADGVIDTTEQKTISNLIAEMNEVTSQVSSAEFTAKLQMITVDGELSADSFKDLSKKVQDAIDEKLDSEEESYYTALTYINVAYKAKMDDAKNQTEKDKLQAEWDADVKELGENFSKTKAEITLTGMTFSLDTLKTNYKTELDKVAPQLATSTSEVIDPALASALKGMDTSEAMSALTFKMLTNYQTALANSGMDTASQQGLQQMLSALSPSTEQLKKIYDDCLAAGTQVPDGVSAALTDAANLGALSGDMDSIAFLLGQKLSTDKTYIDLLATSKGAGKTLDFNFIAGLKSGIPDLKKQGDELVFDVDAAIKTASKTSGEDNMPGYARKIIKGYKSVFESDTSTVNSVNAWLTSIGNALTNWKAPQVSIPAPKIEDFNAGYGEYMGSGGYKINTHANGGFENYGQMFIAREAGPELVGTIGNRTAIANNDQIVASVSQGVASAVASVIAPLLSSSRQSSGEVILMTTDEIIARSANRGNASINGRYTPIGQGG